MEHLEYLIKALGAVKAAEEYGDALTSVTVDLDQAIQSALRQAIEDATSDAKAAA